MLCKIPQDKKIKLTGSGVGKMYITIYSIYYIYTYVLVIILSQRQCSTADKH